MNKYFNNQFFRKLFHEEGVSPVAYNVFRS